MAPPLPCRCCCYCHGVPTCPGSAQWRHRCPAVAAVTVTEFRHVLVAPNDATVALPLLLLLPHPLLLLLLLLMSLLSPLLHPLPQEYTERQRFKFKLSHWQCRDLIETLCRYDAKQRAKRYRRSPTAEGSSVSPHLARLTAIAAHILCSCPGVPRLTRRNARALAGCATSSFSAETFLGRGRHMLA